MKIGIPVWRDLVSNVCDFADTMLVVELDARGVQIGRTSAELHSRCPAERVSELRALGLDVIICGAISRPLASMLAGSGIEIFSFSRGSVDDVLQAYRSGELETNEYLTNPLGCPRRRRRHRRGRGCN